MFSYFLAGLEMIFVWQRSPMLHWAFGFLCLPSRVLTFVLTGGYICLWVSLLLSFVGGQSRAALPLGWVWPYLSTILWTLREPWVCSRLAAGTGTASALSGVSSRGYGSAEPVLWPYLVPRHVGAIMRLKPPEQPGRLLEFFVCRVPSFSWVRCFANRSHFGLLNSWLSESAWLSLNDGEEFASRKKAIKLYAPYISLRVAALNAQHLGSEKSCFIYFIWFSIFLNGVWGPILYQLLLRGHRWKSSSILLLFIYACIVSTDIGHVLFIFVLSTLPCHRTLHRTDVQERIVGLKND